MAYAHQPVPIPRNRLLASLPAAELAQLLPSLEPVELVQRQVVFAPGERIEFVVFPESGWLSHLITLEDGDVGEVGLVGREGMVGVSLLFGDDQTLAEIIVQAQGTALRLRAETFYDALDTVPTLRRRLLRYALALQTQIAQTAACNAHHHVEQRLARWLLTAHDRAEHDAFPMTHEFLSIMLGVRRAGVTVAAGALQRAGFIRYEKGHIEVTDRAGLETASCECFDVVRREFQRLLGPAAPP